MKADKAKELLYKPKLFWEKADRKSLKKVTEYAETYKTFLDMCKTVRETVATSENLLKSNNFNSIYTTKGKKAVYGIHRGKNLAAARFGEKPVSEGVNVVVAHIDSPRIDLKQNPLYEDMNTNLGMLRTHYYGGIRKYQWFSTPLALHGVVIDKKGGIINVSIGEKEDEPVFVIPDLLPHLAQKEQGSKKIGEAHTAGKMNVIFNSIPIPPESEKSIKQAVKTQALVLINELYGIEEKDLLSAELELVPAGKARDLGLDRSMVLGYGQDDRICTFAAMQAILEVSKPDRTVIVLLVDKEEVGSRGNTGADSVFLEDFVADLLAYNGEATDNNTLRKTLIRSHILSADVNVAVNPNFPDVHELQNAAVLGKGVNITKFTGTGGKKNSNDANPEFLAEVLRAFNADGVNWQMGELGKVDEGGGGTVAMFFARYGAEVLDCGTPLISMHAPYEICSKADLYSTGEAYKSFMLRV
ncbi:MAG: aminopeptidase [Candidatus Cloacimonetes bacterium]|nr:aminopeptidase [Candidatus Cloacimonadota bacterium]